MKLVDARGREIEAPTFGEVRQATSALINRKNFGSRANITFGGDRRLHDALGYKSDLTIEDYRARYERSEIAARIVEMMPKDTWRGGFEVIEIEDPEVYTHFETGWIELSTRLNLFSAFERVDILSRLGRYAVLLIGGPGAVSTPLTRVTKPEDIAYVAPFAEDDAQFTDSDLNTDVKDPRCGYPTHYLIRRQHGLRSMVERYHHTRIIHVADGILDHPLFGQPCLARVWNRCDDLEKVVGAGSEAFWLRAHQGYVASFDKEVKMTAEAVEDARVQAEEFAHQIRRTIGLQGGTFESLGSDVADFSNQVSCIVGLIAGASGIPQRMLLGSERGELASSEDRMSYERRVDDRRRETGEPRVINPFIDLMIKIGVLPEPKQRLIRWAGVDNLDDSGRALVARQWALVNSSMKQVVVLPDEIRTRVLNLPPLATVIPSDYEDPFEAEREIKRKSVEKNAIPANENPESKRETENPADREDTVEKTKDVKGVN